MSSTARTGPISSAAKISTTSQVAAWMPALIAYQAQHGLTIARLDEPDRHTSVHRPGLEPKPRRDEAERTDGGPFGDAVAGHHNRVRADCRVVTHGHVAADQVLLDRPFLLDPGRDD